MQNPFIRFVVSVLLAFLLVFALHITILYFLKQFLFQSEIVSSYIINALLVIAVFGLLYFFRNKFKNQLGFLFLFGSALKFAVFFIVFFPIYKSDGVITKQEFYAFFVPYILGLILETYLLSKWLNKLSN